MAWKWSSQGLSGLRNGVQTFWRGRIRGLLYGPASAKRPERTARRQAPLFSRLSYCLSCRHQAICPRYHSYSPTVGLARRARARRSVAGGSWQLIKTALAHQRLPAVWATSFRRLVEPWQSAVCGFACLSRSAGRGSNDTGSQLPYRHVGPHRGSPQRIERLIGGPPALSHNDPFGLLDHRHARQPGLHPGQRRIPKAVLLAGQPHLLKLLGPAASLLIHLVCDPGFPEHHLGPQHRLLRLVASLASCRIQLLEPAVHRTATGFGQRFLNQERLARIILDQQDVFGLAARSAHRAPPS